MRELRHLVAAGERFRPLPLVGAARLERHAQLRVERAAHRRVSRALKGCPHVVGAQRRPQLRLAYQVLHLCRQVDGILHVPLELGRLEVLLVLVGRELALQEGHDVGGEQREALLRRRLAVAVPVLAVGLPLDVHLVDRVLLAVPSDPQRHRAVVLLQPAFVELSLGVVEVHGGDEVAVGEAVGELVDRQVLEQEHLDLEHILRLHPVLDRSPHEGSASLLVRVKGLRSGLDRVAVERGVHVGDGLDDVHHPVVDERLVLDAHEVRHAERARRHLVVLLQNLGEGDVVQVDVVLAPLHEARARLHLFAQRHHFGRVAPSGGPLIVHRLHLLHLLVELLVELRGELVHLLDLAVHLRHEVDLVRPCGREGLFTRRD
mmetsp:Transcript_14656/g.33217  ORF Transcript_14656/g.33217 Transcript_14656/m.33217 type:complete len:375 (+) Transcript_14656:957-2081(+)